MRKSFLKKGVLFTKTLMHNLSGLYHQSQEFLQESTAIKDTEFPHAVVLGGYKTKYMKKVKNFFTKLHPNVPIIITNHQTAEMIKYANNSFLATKISFINQLSNICQKIPHMHPDKIE